MAESTVPTLAISSARPDAAPASFSCTVVAPGDLAPVAQQSGAGAALGSAPEILSSVMTGPVLGQLCFKPLLFNELDDLVDRDAAWIVGHKQQVQILVRLRFAFPFVLNRLNCVKLYQSFFDLVRSVASQDLKLLVHAREIKRDLFQFSGLSCARRIVAARGWRAAGNQQRGGADQSGADHVGAVGHWEFLG